MTTVELDCLLEEDTEPSLVVGVVPIVPSVVVRAIVVSFSTVDSEAKLVDTAPTVEVRIGELALFAELVSWMVIVEAPSLVLFAVVLSA